MTAIELASVLPKKPGMGRLADQFLGAVSSVGANIAEGHSDYKGKQFPRYLRIALGSAYETDNWIQVLKDSSLLEQFVRKEKLDELEELNIEVIKMLHILIKSIEAKRSDDG